MGKAARSSQRGTAGLTSTTAPPWRWQGNVLQRMNHLKKIWIQRVWGQQKSPIMRKRQKIRTGSSRADGGQADNQSPVGWNTTSQTSLGGSLSTCIWGKGGKTEHRENFNTSRSWKSALCLLACLHPPPAQLDSFPQLHMCGVHLVPSYEPAAPVPSDEWRTEDRQTKRAVTLQLVQQMMLQSRLVKQISSEKRTVYIS